MDKITLKDAVEVPVWAMVAATEPSRNIAVEMTYADLVAIVGWIMESVPDENNKEERECLHQTS